MDSMRSILMMLGVILHSVNVFDSKQDWVIYSTNTTIIADYVSDLIHVFRMPAFFLISGFFCVHTIIKYKPKLFFMVRIKRLLIPLLVTGVSLNTLQNCILQYTGFYQLDMWSYIINGDWISHLWFLINLVIYFSLATIIAIFFWHPSKLIGNYLGRLFLSIPLIAIIMLMPVASIAILASNKVGFPLYSNWHGIINVNRICIYLPYFIFGALLGGNHELLHKFSKVNPIFAILLLAVSAFILEHINVSSEIYKTIVSSYFESFIIWLSVSLCFYTFYRMFNTPSKIWSFLSDASYTVYLFHHLIVIGIGIMLIYLEVHPIFSIVILITLTIAITLCIHNYVILKLKYARFLFNGK